jgi:hypothetical protein
VTWFSAPTGGLVDWAIFVVSSRALERVGFGIVEREHEQE